MPGLYLLRQLLTSALTANGLRPARGHVTAVPAMLAGWLTSELAPHVLALTLTDTAVHTTAAGRRGDGPDRLGLALAAASGPLCGCCTSGSSRRCSPRSSVRHANAGPRDPG